eukprot:365378-Chlamydomonas_euryale.AAC.3
MDAGHDRALVFTAQVRWLPRLQQQLQGDRHKAAVRGTRRLVASWRLRRPGAARVGWHPARRKGQMGRALTIGLQAHAGRATQRNQRSSDPQAQPRNPPVQAHPQVERRFVNHHAVSVQVQVYLVRLPAGGHQRKHQPLAGLHRGVQHRHQRGRHVRRSRGRRDARAERDGRHAAENVDHRHRADARVGDGLLDLSGRLRQQLQVPGGSIGNS